MPKYLRFYLLACIALAFGYLVLHAGEPLRLNVGDAWTDASVMSSIKGLEHDHPVPVMVYGAVAKLVGVDQITVFRLLALVFSGLAAWLLFQYARRMWNDTVAIIATAMTATSAVWLMFADSLHRTPIVHAACFLALWGVVRGLETGQRRHYVAALCGTFVCMVTSSNDWLFLPLGVLFTVYVKRGNWRVVVAVCTFGALLALLFRSPFAVSPKTWQFALDQQVAATYATLIRRYTALLTPMVWITLAWTLWRALRAASVKAAIEDGTTWMLVAALLFRYLPPPHPESATLRTQLLLPLYAIGSGLLIARIFDHGRWLRRAFAFTWCVIGPLWGLWLVFSQPREVIGRDDLARANEYLAQSDRNSFVLSNLLADGPIVAAFGRHNWTVMRPERNPASVQLGMLELFDYTGADYAHAVIFTTPGSRFVDRSIRQVLGRRMASADGWPYLIRAKVNELISVYDAQVMRTLDAVGAKRVLHLGNFDIYRIDRSATLEAVGRSLPVVKRIDFGGPAALRHQLRGWGDPVDPDALASNSSITGYGQCQNPITVSTHPARNACTVVETEKGIDVLDVGGGNRAELMVRVERVCDQQLSVTLDAAARVDLVFNGAKVLTCGDPQWGAASVSVRIPQSAVRVGINIIRFEDVQPEPRTVRSVVESVVIEPICEPSSMTRRP